MANPIGYDRREEVWEALSDAFVDKEVDYESIAKVVADVDPVELREIFFTEVAPHCGPNLMSPVPPVWTGFDRKALAQGIVDMQTRNRESLIARIRHRTFVCYLRHRFRDEWSAIETAVGKSSVGHL